MLGQCHYGGAASVSQAIAADSNAYRLGSLPWVYEQESKSRLSLIWDLLVFSGQLYRIRSGKRLVWVLDQEDIINNKWIYRKILHRIVAFFAHNIVVFNSSISNTAKLRRTLWIFSHKRKLSVETFDFGRRLQCQRRMRHHQCHECAHDHAAQRRQGLEAGCLHGCTSDNLTVLSFGDISLRVTPLDETHKQIWST